MEFDRTKSLGGTDVAAILGVHPYKSALDVWMEKAKGFQKEVDNRFVEWGLRLEPAVREKYAQNNNCSITVLQPKYHPDHNWAHGTPDGICSAGAEAWGVEIKTANWRTSDRWGTDEAPILPKEYYIQCAWYMWVFDADRWDVAVLLGGNDYREMTLYRDLELEAEIVERAQSFWLNHIVAEVEPEPETSAAYGDAIGTLYPEDDGEIIEADEDLSDLVVEVGEIRAQLKPLNARYSEIKNLLKGHMKEASRLDAGDFGYVTFKASKPKKSVDWAGVACEVEPSQERLEFLAMKHTKIEEKPRVLRMYPRSKKL